MRKIKTIIVLLLFTGHYSCKSNSENNPKMTTHSTTSTVQVQGHRGDRGNFPENSIPAFTSAVKKGVDVLELDVVISKDKKVVVSHEPYMSSLYVSTPMGDTISKAEERTYNMYEMTYDSIRKFDTGSRGNRLFPEQEKMKTYKPLLSEIIDSSEALIAAEGLKPVKYNIELKSVESEYGKYQPHPEEFVDLVMGVIRDKGIEDRTNVQSFDPEVLNAINKNYADIETAFLVSKQGVEEHLSLLNFRPNIYSPHYKLVNQQLIDTIHTMKMKIIPWTVNDKEDIQKMIDLKVDGIISDYPERVIELVKNKS